MNSIKKHSHIQNQKYLLFVLFMNNESAAINSVFCERKLLHGGSGRPKKSICFLYTYISTLYVTQNKKSLAIRI